MPRMKTSPKIAKIPPSMTPADLLAWRKGHGLSQEDACNMLGISRRPYQYAEKGVTQAGYRLPTVSRILELAVKGLDAELRLVRHRLGVRTLAEINSGEQRPST